MKLANFSVRSGDPRLGCVANSELFDLTGAAQRSGGMDQFADVDSVIAAGADAWGRLADLVSAAASDESLRHEAARVKLLPPLLRSRQIIAIGRNYSEHAGEAGVDLPEIPRLFAKWPSTVIGPGEGIIKPARTEKLDWEIEFAVVIGKSASNVARSRALEHVFGYTILNDVSARDIQFSKPEQLTLGKNFRTFTPLGSHIVTVDEVPNPGDVEVRSWVNGELMQNGTTKDLIFDVPSLVSFISEVMDLQPGDVISTGTPSGVGCFRDPPVFLQPGDHIRMELAVGTETVCSLENPVTSI